MNIPSSRFPKTQAPRLRAEKQEQPKEPWHKQAGDYLEQANDIMTPRLAGLGMAAKFAMKGNQITESLHPVMKVVGIVGGGLVGGAIGYLGGGLLQDLNSTATDAVFGKETGLAKSLVSTGINSAVFGLVGGWTGGALHGVAIAGGAATLARQGLM